LDGFLTGEVKIKETPADETKCIAAKECNWFDLSKYADIWSATPPTFDAAAETECKTPTKPARSAEFCGECFNGRCLDITVPAVCEIGGQYSGFGVPADNAACTAVGGSALVTGKVV